MGWETFIAPSLNVSHHTVQCHLLFAVGLTDGGRGDGASAEGGEGDDREDVGFTNRPF